MRISTKGQVTIPVELREKFGLMPNTEVAFVVADTGVKLVTKLARRKKVVHSN